LGWSKTADGWGGGRRLQRRRYWRKRNAEPEKMKAQTERGGGVRKDGVTGGERRLGIGVITGDFINN